MSNPPQRHQDKGNDLCLFSDNQWAFLDEQWVVCQRCQGAGIADNHRFVCRHCALKLQNTIYNFHYFGKCELSAYGRCQHCGAKYQFAERYAQTNEVRNLQLNRIFRCQSCQQDDTANFRISKQPYQGFDDYFGMPLLLTANFKGHLFWAYNDEHLAELKAFIEAELRERHHLIGRSNGSMISRLPLWIKSAKNRDELLKLIEKLEKITL